MTIARSTGAFLGTSESVGLTVVSNTPRVGAEVDLLADATSIGLVNLYLKAVVPAGSKDAEVRVQVYRNRVTTVGYADPALLFERRLAPGATHLVILGTFLASRYMSATFSHVFTADLTGVAVLYELEKSS